MKSHAAWRMASSRTSLVVALGAALGAVACVAGIVLSGSGPEGSPQLLTSAVFGNTLLAFGSALVGACLSIAVGRLGETLATERMIELVDELKSDLVRTTTSRMVSDESDLQPLRRKMYHYHLTSVDGVLMWRHRIYNFHESGGIGVLRTVVSVDDPRGGTHQYEIEVGVRGTRVVVVQRRLQGQEDVVVGVYPQMLHGFKSTHFGICILQNWDSESVLTKCILSYEPVLPEQAPGAVPPDKAAELDTLWGREFARVNRLLVNQATAGSSSSVPVPVQDR